MQDRPAIAGDPRFFSRTGPYSLAAVADAAQGKAPPRRLMLTGIAPLQTAADSEVSFLDNRKYADALAKTRAAAVIVHPEMAARVPEGCVAIETPEPYAAWARVAALFHPHPPVNAGIHRAAVVEEGAVIDASAEIGPLAVIGAGAEIGPRCRIGPGAVIGANVVMGADCRVGAQATISHALIGRRVYIYPGVRIGQEGFGFALTDEGFLSVPQLGRVLIKDDVEIGANCTIDRGSLQDTVIGAGTRIDNLCQIGHNVRIGRACVIVAQVGISGSTTIEDHVMLGGQAGLVGHIHIGRGARISAQAGVMSDVPAGATMTASPARPAKEFFRYLASLRRMVREDADRRSHENATRKAGKDTDTD